MCRLKLSPELKWAKILSSLEMKLTQESRVESAQRGLPEEAVKLLVPAAPEATEQVFQPHQPIAFSLHAADRADGSSLIACLISLGLGFPKQVVFILS